MIAKVFKTLGVLCAGAGIGAGVALLYAPQSGKRTRRDLAQYGAQKLNQLRDFQEDVSDKVDDVWQSSKRLPHRIWPRAS